MQSPSIPSRHIEDEQQKVFNDETDAFEEKEELLDSSNIQPEILPLESEYFIKAVKNYEEVTIKKRYKRILNFMDSLSALTVVVILVVGFWRGSWMLGDIYLVKVPLTVIIIAATSVHSILILSKDCCSKFSDKTKRTISMTVFRRFHTFLYAEACVFTFKGYWGVLDAFYGITFLPDTRIGSCGKPLLAWSVSTASFVGLLVLKCFNNSLGPPFAISVDDRDTSFNFPTMFKTKMQKTSLYILDTVFSVYIVGTLVVFVWRGAWILIDLYLFPGNITQSSWASLVIGYGGAVVAYCLQPLMRWICNRLTGGLRLLASDIFLIMCFIFTVNTWRGIWNLLNIYFLPDNLELSCWITHWVCFILLVLLKCSNSLLVRGVFIDGEEPGGRCVVFPVYYLRLIFEHEKSKKIKKIQQDFANKLKIENDNPKLSSVISNHIAINMNSKDLKGHGIKE